MIPRRRAQNGDSSSQMVENGSGATEVASTPKVGRARTSCQPLQSIVIGLFLLVTLFLVFHSRPEYAVTTTTTTSTNGSAIIQQAEHQLNKAKSEPLITDVVDDTAKETTEQQQQATPPQQQQESSKKKKDDDPWKKFEKGDLNHFYNDLEKDLKRNKNNLEDYAVHRWMGNKHSTFEHYELMRQAVDRYHPTRLDAPKRIFDGGCGLGAGLMWFEKTFPSWQLLGHTISEVQYKWITETLPPHQFQVALKSYDDLDQQVDFIYTIEALLHSPNLTHTFQQWASHMNEGGILIVIDDFLSIGTSRDDELVQAFMEAWQAPSFCTPTEMVLTAKQFGLVVREARDLNAEYQINEAHYKNKLEPLVVSGKRTHQAWKGSKVRGHLMVLGKMTYNMMVFQKPITTKGAETVCTAVGAKDNVKEGSHDVTISPADIIVESDLILSSHQCNKGSHWFDQQTKTNDTNMTISIDVPLEKDVFGDYKTVFASRLEEFYNALSPTSQGKFVNIDTTTTASSTSTNTNSTRMAGPLEYWTLQPTNATHNNNNTSRTIDCNITNCPTAPDCFFDVTYSHGVLEHSARPWEALDEIARITKQGGLTLHLVPFSFPFHTQHDHYRFSHVALSTLMEERGFQVLNVGYDVCTKSKTPLRSGHDSYEVVWLTYIVAKKK